MKKRLLLTKMHTYTHLQVNDKLHFHRKCMCCYCETRKKSLVQKNKCKIVLYHGIAQIIMQAISIFFKKNWQVNTFQ